VISNSVFVYSSLACVYNSHSMLWYLYLAYDLLKLICLLLGTRHSVLHILVVSVVWYGLLQPTCKTTAVSLVLINTLRCVASAESWAAVPLTRRSSRWISSNVVSRSIRPSMAESSRASACRYPRLVFEGSAKAGRLRSSATQCKVLASLDSMKSSRSTTVGHLERWMTWELSASLAYSTSDCCLIACNQTFFKLLLLHFSLILAKLGTHDLFDNMQKDYGTDIRKFDFKIFWQSF